MSQAAQAATAPPPKPLRSHPPYADMIITAIRALKERNGSSKKAIAKYIGSAYTNLPPSHSALLSHHLKRLKKNGVVLMVKQSYKLPKPASASSSSASDGAPKKRGRGRPPKPKVGLPAGPVLLEKRGRGRPPKVPKPKPISVVSSGALGQKKGRGRPPKPKPSVVVGPDGVSVPVPRGRPRKNVPGGVGGGGNGASVPIVASGSMQVVVPPVFVRVGRPRGRPPKVGASVKPKRPVGRPKKVAAEAAVAE